MVLEISVLTQWGRRAYIRSKRFFLSGANGQRKGFVGNCYNECGFIHFFDTDRIQDVIFLQGRTLISEGRIPIKLNIIQAACRQNASFFNYRYHGHTDEHTFPVFVRPQRPKDCIVGNSMQLGLDILGSHECFPSKMFREPMRESNEKTHRHHWTGYDSLCRSFHLPPSHVMGDGTEETMAYCGKRLKTFSFVISFTAQTEHTFIFRTGSRPHSLRRIPHINDDIIYDSSKNASRNPVFALGEEVVLELNRTKLRPLEQNDLFVNRPFVELAAL